MLDGELLKMVGQREARMRLWVQPSVSLGRVNGTHQESTSVDIP